MGQIVALRERRDSPKSENKNEGYEGSGGSGGKMFLNMTVNYRN
jgi:hypothetical protein